MDTRFHPAMLAAWGGGLTQFTAILDDSPELVTARSTCSHPTLLQFVALDGGVGKIGDPIPFCRALIDRGALLEEPIVAAASVGARAILEYLLERGAPVESSAPWTPLEEAVYWAHRDLAEYLWRECEAAVASLRVAAGLGSLDLAAAFFAAGAIRPEAGPVRYPWGRASAAPRDVLNQALVIAAKNGRIETTSLLLENGAEVNAFPPGIHEKGAPLHLAALYGRAEVVSLLLHHGADPSLRDLEHHATPAGWATHGGFPELADRLEV